MNTEQIKTATSLKLKPNPYLKNPDIARLYQKRAILLMLTRQRMVLGDDVGLGKTLEAIMAFTYMKAAKPETKALVLTEKAALFQWRDEFAWLTQGIRTRVVAAADGVSGVERKRLFRTHNSDVIITTYAMLYKYHEAIREGMQPRWVLIADEPSAFKNEATQLHGKIFEMVNGEGGAVRAYGLTATIVENRLEEAFGVMRVVTPGTLPSRKRFTDEFCITKTVREPIPKSRSQSGSESATRLR